MHLEDILISWEDIWNKIKERKSGSVKNWLTNSHPQSNNLTRQPALSEIANYINNILKEKLEKLRVTE